MILNHSTWSSYADAVSGRSTRPEDYSPAAVERLVKDLGEYIIDVKGIKSQFKAQNGIGICEFENYEDRKFYEDAYERYLAEKAKIQASMDSGGGGTKLDILVQLIKFQQAAELVKARTVARMMWESVQSGKAAVAALKYKASIAKSVKILVEDYNVPRDQISLIWGGGQTTMSSSRKKKLEVKEALNNNSLLMDLLTEGGINMYDLGLGSVEKVITFEEDPSLRLGAQDPLERQREIDRFQKGKSLYCFFTFKSGGVGLSLHHTDDLTAFKCRRKESGYVVEEDIPIVPTRQRELFCAVTYSAIELVQGLGRCARLTSLSDTKQTVLFYRGTIEEQIAYVVSVKLKCLRKVTRGGKMDSWEDVIMGGLSKERAQEAEEGRKLIDNGARLEDEEEDGMEFELVSEEE